MDDYADMPPLVDSNANPRRDIPPPQNATFMAGSTPFNAHAGWNSTMPQPTMPPQPGATFMAGSTPFSAHAGWNSTMPQPTMPQPTMPQSTMPQPTMPQPTMPQRHPPFPVQEEWVRWHNHWQGNVASQPQSMPSPYIPHVPFPETWGNPPHGPLRRVHSLSSAYPSNPQPRAAQWNAWQPSPFHSHVRTQNIPFPAYSNASSHTPASAVSMSRPLSMSYVPPDWPGEAPKSWRRDFKFKSGFSSLFRSRSVSRPPDEFTNSALLNISPILQYDRGDPAVILDLRRSVSLLVFRALDRHVFANDLMRPTTDPPTAFMRLYHTRLPWYIDVVPSGNGPYVTLGDLFTTICQTLARRIRGEEYYNDVLDHEDREALKQAWDKRCRSQEERMDGVKRVDFLRGKYMFEGLTRGKHGMWQLRTGREQDY